MKNHYLCSLLALPIALGVCSSGLYACGPSSSEPVPPPAQDAAPPADANTRDAKAADSGGIPPRTEGTSCANAVAATLGTEIPDEFTKAGESVYYSFDVTLGDYFVVAASTASTDQTAAKVVDTAIKLYDATGKTLLASDDDAYPRGNSDAQIVYRTTVSGKVCVQVTDFDTWAGSTPKLAEDSTFKFFAGKFNSTLPSVNLDAEPNDTVAIPQVGKLAPFTAPAVGASSFVLGYLQGAVDVDTFKFTAPAGTNTLSLDLPPIGAALVPGISGFGSTMERFAATIRRMDGTIVADVTPPAGAIDKTPLAFTVPFAAGDYYLSISRPVGLPVGANDFYYTRIGFGKSTTVPEAELTAGSNDTLATAEPLTQTVNAANAKLKNAFIIAQLPALDAADNFSVPVNAGDKVTVACSSLRSGAGLTGFTAKLFLDGQLIESDVETATANMAWRDTAAGQPKIATKDAVKITQAGTAVLQLSATGRSATNTGAYYLCGFSVTAP
jgi:hypothetical protein